MCCSVLNFQAGLLCVGVCSNFKIKLTFKGGKLVCRYFSSSFLLSSFPCLLSFLKVTAQHVCGSLHQLWAAATGWPEWYGPSAQTSTKTLVHTEQWQIKTKRHTRNAQSSFVMSVWYCANPAPCRASDILPQCVNRGAAFCRPGTHKLLGGKASLKTQETYDCRSTGRDYKPSQLTCSPCVQTNIFWLNDYSFTDHCNAVRTYGLWPEVAVKTDFWQQFTF